MLQRLLERGKTSGRADDNEESIKKRFSASLTHPHDAVPNLLICSRRDIPRYKSSSSRILQREG